MLILNFEICQSTDCKDLSFSETTGAYNATYNIGGYGTPNIELATVTKAVLTSTSPDGTIYTTNLFTHGFPTDDLTDDPYVITLIPNTTLADGKWIFTYTITSVSAESVVTTYSKTITKLLYCNSECCVESMLANLKITDCDCCDKDLNYDEYILTWLMLESLKKAAKCGDITSFDKILKIINKLCKNKACKTCK